MKFHHIGIACIDILKTAKFIQSTFNIVQKTEVIFDTYQNNLLGIISDIRFPKADKKDSKAGILFSEYVHSKDEGIPIILQTTDISITDSTINLTDLLLNKNSSTDVAAQEGDSPDETS